jgi:hypothetical protein
VIGASGVTYDQNGSATGMVETPTQSWTGNEYTAWGSVSQVAAAPYFLGVSFWAQAGGMYSPGTAFIPIDSISNYAVSGNAYGSEVPDVTPDAVHSHDTTATLTANGILSHAEWNKFKQSNCAAVFKLGLQAPNWNGYPYMTYDTTLANVQVRQSQLNFYDTGNPNVANLKLSVVTGGLVNNPVGLYDYLFYQKAVAATPLLGRPGPIILEPGFFNRQTVPYPQFILVHEVLLHAYAGLSDDNVYSAFANNGLWNDKQGSANITKWMSTDCTCTPGNTTPGAPACQANTATW